ncbi:polyprotein of retroviral origin, putative [Trichonephila inaurata madagascariensis]|uniref:Polyprotein of retroviral origin, putative n=1 Tax=Trichonephila inaurata madagascariensis TaxID=2747483 RepID=A0A8X6K8T6_9ARAC|nr:polyprotein of retroviral origin, putative [Trichonephila inaurata madagascariensis]
MPSVIYRFEIHTATSQATPYGKYSLPPDNHQPIQCCVHDPNTSEFGNKACWIFGIQIKAVSDHNPLTFLTEGLPHGIKLARWALALQRYVLRIIYRKGKNHGNADALSRLPSDD